MSNPAQPPPSLEDLSSWDLLERLSPDLRRGALGYLDWLLRVTPPMSDPVAIIEGIAEGLLALGVPIDRYRSSLTVNTADADAVGRIWIRGRGVSETSYSGSGKDDPEYLRSPFFEASKTGRWVDLWLPETPDARFGIVPDLKAAGYTHYLCAPLRTPENLQGFLTVATKASDGFSASNRIVLALVLPVLSALISTRISRIMLDRLLRTYVGDEPHRAILDGHVKRGQVTTIRSAILFADMRDSTGHTAEISAVEAVTLFNDFFDCLVPPIESRGGEVLKYIGDGLLAIFRDSADGTRDAAVMRWQQPTKGSPTCPPTTRAARIIGPVELGIALHYGEAAYGNVGSGLRLDFTVIGRDVALASRIGTLNARLGEPLLMSSAFVAKLGGGVEPIGSFTVRGFSTPMAVFRPEGRAL